MSFPAQVLTQARESLVLAALEKQGLVNQIKDMSKKISDLELEVQKQSTARVQLEQALSAARTEIAALRAQLPDEPTRRAFDSLVQHLSNASALSDSLRLAA